MARAKTFYICDGLACYAKFGGICTYSECRHTSDPEHALDRSHTHIKPWLREDIFVKDDQGNFWEYFWNIFKEEELK